MKFFILILIFTAVAAYGLWSLSETTAPDVSSEPESVATSTDSISTSETAVTSSEAAENEDVATTTANTRTIEGVFLSLQEMEAEWRTGHTYLLLDDGTEIFRIDLRPLLGDTTRDVAQKLGVVRGERVTVTGTVNADGAFRIQSIAPVSPVRTAE